jgi:hypothetical protein
MHLSRKRFECPGDFAPEIGDRLAHGWDNRPSILCTCWRPEARLSADERFLPFTLKNAPERHQRALTLRLDIEFGDVHHHLIIDQRAGRPGKEGDAVGWDRP